MEFNIKGIIFTKDELESITLEEIPVNNIGLNHLFIMAGQRPFLISKAGDFVEESLLEKYRGKGIQSFYSLPIARRSVIESFKDKLNAITEEKLLLDKKLSSDLFYQYFIDLYYKEQNESFLNFVIACYESFYSLPTECIRKLWDTSLVLYHKSLLQGCISVLGSLTLEIYDHSFLKDIYNCATMLDIGLVHDGPLDYRVFEMCKKEWSKRNDLNESVPSIVDRNIDYKDFYEQHPLRSFEYLKNFEHHFSYVSIIEYIKYHHENRDGSGFPHGLYYTGLAKNEMIVSFCDEVCSYDISIYGKGDCSKLFSERVSLLSEESRKNTGLSYYLCKSWKEIVNFYMASSVQLNRTKDCQGE